MERARELLRTDEGGGARTLGGLLLATGVLVLVYRRTALGDPWSSGPLFFILAAASASLYGTGLWGARQADRPLTWHRAFLVFGLILLPVALYAFVDWIGGDTDAPLNSTWIMLVTAGAGFAAALLANLRVGCLIAGLALIIAWLTLWDELLEAGVGGDIGTLRGLLVLIALVLLGLAAAVGIRGRPEGGPSDLVTAAGLAAVSAGAISLGALGSLGFYGVPVVDTNLLWDIELLVASLLLLLYGAGSGARGPVYVGVFGLFAFTYIVGLDLDDASPAGKVLGWPLILLAVGAALMVWSLRPALRREPD